MWWMAAALAADLVVELRAPGSVDVDGKPAASLAMPGVVTLDLPPRPTRVVVHVGGRSFPVASTPGSGRIVVDEDGPVGAPATTGDVLAIVGDDVVRADEFATLAARKTPADGVALSADERREVLRTMIDERALRQEALREGVLADPKVANVLVNTLRRNRVYSSVRNSDFTDEQLRDYFDRHRDEFVVPEKIQIKRIFLAINAERSEAEARRRLGELRRRLTPDNFGDLAAEHSEDPFRRRGGDLGFVSREGKLGIDQAVIDRAFSLGTGETSEVFVAGGGANLVLVASRREEVARTFEQMRGSILRRVKNDRYKELYEAYVRGVSAKYRITVFEDRLAAVPVEHGLSLQPTQPPGPVEPSQDEEIPLIPE